MPETKKVLQNAKASVVKPINIYVIAAKTKAGSNRPQLAHARLVVNMRTARRPVLHANEHARVFISLESKLSMNIRVHNRNPAGCVYSPHIHVQYTILHFARRGRL